MKNVLWVALAALLVAYFLVGRRADRGREIVFDRLWIDHLPRSERDVFRLFILLDDNPIGLFDQRTIWRGEWEMFRYEAQREGELELVYPADNSRERVRCRAWRCDHGEFMFCLELSGGKGAQHYYSKKQWEVRSLEAARTFAEKLAR